MTYNYKPTGVCTRLITLQLEDGIVKDVEFKGGCNGNLQGIRVLVQGMRATEAIEKLKGIRCGASSTSCPDQLAVAIGRALDNKDNED